MTALSERKPEEFDNSTAPNTCQGKIPETKELVSKAHHGF